MSVRAKIVVKNMDLAYDDVMVQRDLNFIVNEGDIFAIMGRSGSGKSTLMKQLIGLKTPARGDAWYDGKALWAAEPEERQVMVRHFGILYQNGALWSSLTLGENVALPLSEYTDLSERDIRDLACLKLGLVGLGGFEEYYPAQLSGGMRKRAGLARAMALDPDILFFDEPSAGLDPISSRHLDDLILALRDSLGCTVVIVSHELASIFAICNNSIFLDAEEKRAIDGGDPKVLVRESRHPHVREFLTRGEPTEALP
jgi:phospholipid/cholesterol/gamma-HCH transport system ATP-binding protein